MELTRKEIARVGGAAAALFAALGGPGYAEDEAGACVGQAMAEAAQAAGYEEDLPEAAALGEEEAMEALDRVGALTAAALAVRASGHYPYYIEKAIAAGVLLAARKGVALSETLTDVTGLWEPDVRYCILQHAERLQQGFAGEDAAQAAYIKRAYALGFASEKTYRGCGQCAIAALDELLGERHDDIFKSATGFSGGMALCGDGVCGGYAGGMMILSVLRGRAFAPMCENGDKINQYAAYETAQMLHDRFVACYGTPICSRIHERMFESGQSYILRTKARRNEFEEAGAHTVVCTTVVALACAWTAQIMLKKRLVRLPREEE